MFAPPRLYSPPPSIAPRGNPRPPSPPPSSALPPPPPPPPAASAQSGEAAYAQRMAMSQPQSGDDAFARRAAMSQAQSEDPYARRVAMGQPSTGDAAYARRAALSGQAPPPSFAPPAQALPPFPPSTASPLAHPSVHTASSKSVGPFQSFVPPSPADIPGLGVYQPNPPLQTPTDTGPPAGAPSAHAPPSSGSIAGSNAASKTLEERKAAAAAIAARLAGLAGATATSSSAGPLPALTPARQQPTVNRDEE